MRLREEQAKSLAGGRIMPKGIFAISRDDALLYLAAFAIVVIGIWGVTFAVESNLLGLFLFCGALLGFLSSLYARQSKNPLFTALLPLAGILGIIFLLRFAGWEIASIIPTDPAMVSPELTAISSLSLVLIICTFGLINREILPFCIVPVLAIFGLLGYFIDPRVIIAFLIFLMVSIFLLVFEHTVTLREKEGLRLSGGEAKHLPQNQLLVASGFFLTVLAIGFSITLLLVAVLSRQQLTVVVETISRIVRLTPKLPRNQSPSSALQSAQDNFRVGQGPIALGQNVVMSVKADYPGLWRQRVYDVYTGIGWRIEERAEPQRIRVKDAIAQLRPFPSDKQTNTQIYRLATTFLDGLPAEAQAAEVTFRPPLPLHIVVDRFGCLVRTDLVLSEGTEYKVVSVTNSLAGPPPAELAELGQEERGIYLQIPWGARRIRPLARELVPESASPEEKIALLVGYLQSDRFNYSLQAKAVPAGEDAVEYFLFRSRVGYCDLFASAFALMCRAVNIPSRVAVGFASGEPDPETEEYVVKEADGHAWVEVFLEDRGWVTVDPTPAGAAQSEREKLKTPVPSWKLTLRRIRIPLIFISLALLVIGALLKVLLFDPWWEQSRWEKRMLGSRAGSIAIFYSRMLRLLGERGLVRQP